MNTSAVARQKLHPVLWTAAISVTLASLVAVAAMTGLLPKSQASTAPAPVGVAPTAMASPAVQATVTPAIATAAADKPAVRRHPVRHAVKQTDKAMAYDADAYTAARGYPPPTPLAQADIPPPPAVCTDCGVIESVHQIAHEGEGSGIGAVAGGVLGGALGNNVGRGNGRTLATLAGIIGGAFAGNKVEKNMHESTHYEITVRFDDGSRHTFTEAIRPPWRAGERVKLNNGALTYES